MDPQTAVQIENKVKHLCTVANTLTTLPIFTILKSYYFTKCRMLTLSGSVSLPQRFSKSTIRCPRCCIQYDDALGNVKIQPNRKNRFVESVLKRNASGKSLTRYQDKYLKNLKRKEHMDVHNTLVITCGVCKQETKEILKKPESSNINATEEKITEVILKTRKKKKKKDRFSGLDKNAVLSATPQHKAYNTNDFVPLETTLHVTPGVRNNLGQKSNLFNKHQKNKIKKQNISAINKKVKNKQKKSKGLSSILNDSTPSKKPSALKLFLTSI